MEINEECTTEHLWRSNVGHPTIAGSEINRLSPYLEDSNPTSGGGDKYVWSSRFTDALSPKFLERFSVNSNLQTSLAMNDFAVNDTRRTMPWCDRDKCQSFNKESRLDETSRDPSIVSGSDYARVYGSFTGSVGPTGLSSNDPSAPTEDVILLSFSGGGPTTEYIYSTNEVVDDAYYAINMNLDATAENSFAMAIGACRERSVFEGQCVLEILLQKSRFFLVSLRTHVRHVRARRPRARR